MKNLHLSVPSLAMLNAFEAFGREGSVRKAALVLRIDHAAVSRHLKALEARVGTALIDRGGGGSILTPDGVSYHARICAALREIAHATEALRQRDKRHLVLWCVPGFAYHWLAPRLIAFGQRYPEIDIELRPSDREPDFKINEADADIRYLRTGVESYISPHVKSLEIGRPLVFPVARPALAMEAMSRIREPKDFLNERLLHEENDDEWGMWLQAQGLRIGERLSGQRLWHAHVMLDAARQGNGIALANAFILGDDLEKGRLMPVLPRDAALKPIPLGGYNLLGREDRWKSISFVRFRDWLCETVEKMQSLR